MSEGLQKSSPPFEKGGREEFLSRYFKKQTDPYLLISFMIYGIGIDLVKIKRIADAHRRWGARFHNKAFTPGEIRYCLRKKDPAPNFAARFAAKEALAKALGIGLRRGVHLRDVEVQRGALGKPVLLLHGRAKEICAREGITGIFLSLTHDQDFSSAVVILEKP